MNGICAGIIGYGYMGHFHKRRMDEVEGIQAVAAFDIEPAKVQQAVLDGMAGYDSFQEFLDHPQLDMVVICTPNDSHCMYAVESLQKGKHVLCEKPVTLNVKELKEIQQACEQSGKIFTIHQNRRWDVDFRVVKKIVDERIIGEPFVVESQTYGQRGVCFGWRSKQENGGGMLYDWGVHLIDQILQLFPNKKVLRIFAQLRSILTPEVDDYFNLMLMMEQNICVNISVGTFALQNRPRWYIFGDRGTLRLDDFSGTKGGMARIKGEVQGFERVTEETLLGPSRTMAPLKPENLETLPLPVVTEAPLAFYEDMVRAIRNHTQPEVRLEQVERVMMVIEQAMESSKNGKVMEVYI